ncbi:hypothetical protein BDZ89DRAFT_92821 [Hymenopellis radicata]|nr:hypothetical protein BDZ89DRAFT_92821 [Hymenopellis radicata]
MSSSTSNHDPTILLCATFNPSDRTSTSKTVLALQPSTSTGHLVQSPVDLWLMENRPRRPTLVTRDLRVFFLILISHAFLNITTSASVSILHHAGLTVSLLAT